jgi:hypothetical protein
MKFDAGITSGSFSRLVGLMVFSGSDPGQNSVFLIEDLLHFIAVAIANREFESAFQFNFGSAYFDQLILRNNI